MKNTIKIGFAVFILAFSLNLYAQPVTTASTSLDTYISSVADIAPVPQGNYVLAQDYFHFDNPEINKLESEVNQLSSLYMKDRWGKNNGFSSNNYKDLTESEKKDIRTKSQHSRYYYLGTRPEKDEDKNQTLEQKAEEYFNKIIKPYLVSAGSEYNVNKQKLSEDIKRKVDQLFEMKENDKQKQISKLEEQIKVLQGTLSERKKNKQQIIDQRLSELLGLPNHLKW